MKQYTICGYFEDNLEIFVVHVIAKTETQAVVKISKAINADPNDVMIIAIFEGIVKNLNECQSVSCAKDWEGK